MNHILPSPNASFCPYAPLGNLAPCLELYAKRCGRSHVSSGKKLARNIRGRTHTDPLYAKKACKDVRQLVDGCARIQYRVELARAGYEDGPMPCAVFTRRSLLKAHLAAWEGLAWTVSHIPSKKYAYQQLCKGVYTYSEGRRIDCVKLPSILYRTAPREWVHEDVGFDIAGFATDPEQDLLILLEHRPYVPPLITIFFDRVNDVLLATYSEGYRGRAWEPRVHVRTLSTNQPHPRVRDELLQIPEESYNLLNPSIKIMGTTLGIMFTEGTYSDIRVLVIWDLQAGTIIAVRMHTCHSFTLAQH